MANFLGHITVGAAGSGILSSGLLSLGMLSPKEASIAFILGSIGGLLPDVDLDHSKPFVVGTQIFAVFIAFAIMFSKAVDYSLLEMALLWSGVYFLSIYLILNVFKKYTVHRGMFHSIPAAILSGLMMTNLAYYFFDFNTIVSWVYGFFIFYGYVIHLILDEYVSVNIFGDKVKKSLGTAFKFFDKKNYYSTLSTYIAIVLFFMLSPQFQEFKDAFLDIELLKSIGDIILPRGIWFENFIKFK